MATSSVAIPSTRRGWSGHVTVPSQAAKSRIPNRRPPRSLTPPVLETKLSPPVRPFLAPTLEFIFGRAAMAMTMTIERVIAFMGLDLLVAKDEGLFAAEARHLRAAPLPPLQPRSAARESPPNATTNQGKVQP